MSERTAVAPAQVNGVPRPILVAMLVALVGGLIFIRPYVGAVLFAAVIALAFNPVYKGILRRRKSPSLAIAGTLLAVVAAVIIPLLVIVTVTVTQAASIVNKVSDSTLRFGTADIQKSADGGIARVNNVLHELPGGEKLKLNREQVNSGLKNAAVRGLNFAATLLANIGRSFFGLISTFILIIFLIIGMLRYQEELLSTIKKISPFDEHLNRLYLNKIGLMTSAMVKGQLVISLAQGFLAALSLWIVGVDYFWFFFVLLSFLSFIPLGAGIITIPIGIVLIFTGHIWQGLFVIIFHFTVVSFIDNILRPKLVPRGAELNPALLILGVFSGLAFFGAAGVIYGPVVMIVIVTTIYVYSQYNKTVQKVSLPSIKSSKS